MNRIHRLALTAATAAAVLSLAACKKEAVVAKNESVEEVGKKVAASAIKPLPGRWESNMKLDKIELPNMPPQAKQMFAKQLGVTQTFASCLTPAQVDQPGAGFFQKGGDDCKYDRFVMADGRIDAEMSCKGPAATPIRMTMQGAYTPSDYTIVVNTQGEMQPGMPMTMAMTINSRRTGDCTGAEEK